ncbi:hypothetical protein LguiB_035382 [Lonicera macranthoides]
MMGFGGFSTMDSKSHFRIICGERRMVFRSKSHFKRMNRKEQTGGGRFQHPPFHD